MHEIDGQIALVAARQNGLFTLRQVTDAGGNRTLIDRRCRAGRWQRIAPRVYLIAGAPRTFEQKALAAALSAGTGALVSHRTATRLWRVSGNRSVPIEVSIPYGRYVERNGILVHRARDLDLAEPTSIGGIPVTGLARTLLDLGAVDPGRVRRAVARARRNHGLEWDGLLRTLVAHGRKGRAGIGPLRQVVSAHYGMRATDSETEDLALEILLDSGLVPRPDTQVPVVCADGVPVTIDLGWPRWRALVEVFGVDHFTNEDVQQMDLHRCNQIELAGYGLLVYSGRLLEQRPDQFVSDVRRLLVSRGWSG